MKLYKSPQGEIYGYPDDGAHDYLIPKDFIKFTNVEIQEWEKNIANEKANTNRHAAYLAESDSLFFKAQRGEGTMADWEAKVAEIKARYPKVQP